MDQERLNTLLLDYWLGEPISEKEKEEIQLWLGESEKHRQQYETLKREYLRQRWAMRQGLITRKGERRYRVVAKRKGLIKRITAIAASIIVLVGIGYYGWRPEPETVVIGNQIHTGTAKAKLYLSSGEEIMLAQENKAIHEREEVAIQVNESGEIAYRDTVGCWAGQEMAHNRLVINRGGEYKLVLSDSSEIWINSASELVYPIRFAGNKRVVKLQGEAYFKVHADPMRPFVVEVNGVEVKAVGTEFTVSSRNVDKIESVLVKGKVEVRGKGAEAVLRPNQLAVYDLLTQRITVENVDVRKFIDWKNGDFIFSDDRLEDVMDKISLWYDCDVFYQDAKLKETRLSGDMKRYGQVDEFLHFMELSTGIVFEVRGKTIVIGSKLKRKDLLIFPF